MPLAAAMSCLGPYQTASVYSTDIERLTQLKGQLWSNRLRLFYLWHVRITVLDIALGRCGVLVLSCNVHNQLLNVMLLQLSLYLV